MSYMCFRDLRVHVTHVELSYESAWKWFRIFTLGVGTTIQNSRPENIRQSDTLTRFNAVFKPHLFKLAYSRRGNICNQVFC